MRKHIFLVLAVAAFAFMTAANVWRTMRVYQTPAPPDQVDNIAFGHIDFHNAVYFPGKAFANGDNPYSKAYASKYPVNFEMSPYSPGLLPLIMPFGLLPLDVADVLWFAVNLALTLCFAKLVRDEFGWSNSATALFAIAAFMLASRAGHSNQILGQLGMLFAIGTTCALRYARSSTWKSSLGVAIATLKPTFGIPLVILMWCQNRHRPVLLGLAVGGIVALGGAGWIVANGNSQLLSSIEGSNETTVYDPDVASESAWNRIDLFSVIDRIIPFPPSAAVELIAMLVFLSPSAFLLWRMQEAADDAVPGEPDQMHLADVIVLATIPMCAYGQSYDALLVLAAFGALLAGRSDEWKQIPTLLKWLVAAALLVPILNYLATWSFLDRLQIEGSLRISIVSASGVSLLVANLLLWWAATRKQNRKALLPQRHAERTEAANAIS